MYHTPGSERRELNEPPLSQEEYARRSRWNEPRSTQEEYVSKTGIFSPKLLAAEALAAGASLAGAIVLRQRYKHAQYQRMARASLRHPMRGPIRQKEALLAAGAGLAGLIALKQRHNLAQYLHLGKTASSSDYSTSRQSGRHHGSREERESFWG